MKYRLIAMVLNRVAKRMDGHKTRVGALTKGLAGVQVLLASLVEVLTMMFPETGVPAVKWEAVAALATITYAFGSGLQGVGEAHKHEKEAELIKQMQRPHDLESGSAYDGT